LEATGAIGKASIRDLDVTGLRVLVRADLNVPLDDGAVADDTRIRASVPTIETLARTAARVIVCSHLGRPKGRSAPDLTLAPIAPVLAEQLGRPVTFAADCVGEAAAEAVESAGDGGVVLLENLRFHPGEETNDPEFAAQLAALADVYVNDAFGAAHRAHASTERVAHLMPSAAGLLLEKEVRYLGTLVADPPRPCAAIIGGAKVSSKLAAIEHLLRTVDLLVLGGGMANTFLKACGVEVGKSLVEDDLLDAARRITAAAAESGTQLLLPSDVVIADEFSAYATATTISVGDVPCGSMILDIGQSTVREYASALSPAGSIIWNGPMGVFEFPQFSHGSFGLAEVIAGLDAVTVVGGGETAAVIARTGLAGRFTHISTGGGASLEMLEGKILPGVAALDDA
jgi:phosphoglycerate kinase